MHARPQTVVLSLAIVAGFVGVVVTTLALKLAVAALGPRGRRAGIARRPVV